MLTSNSTNASTAKTLAICTDDSQTSVKDFQVGQEYITHVKTPFTLEKPPGYEVDMSELEWEVQKLAIGTWCL